MNEHDILGRIHELVEEEHRLRDTTAEHGDTERARIAELERHLDQAWDLLRQRRAKQQYGQDTEAATDRPESQVEGYLQ